METKSNLDKFIINWLNSIEKITYFSYSIEPDYNAEYGEGLPDITPDYPGYVPPQYDLDILIKDEKGNKLFIFIPLDGISNPLIQFFGIDKNIKYEGDVSICDSILKLINKHKLLELE